MKSNREDQTVYIDSCLQTCSGLFTTGQLLTKCLEPLANLPGSPEKTWS